MKCFQLLLLLLLISACEADDDASHVIDTEVYILHPRQGQQSRFVRLGELCEAPHFTYLPDTLLLTTEVIDGLIYLNERYTERSQSYASSPEAIRYRVVEVGDAVIIEHADKSRLFASFSADVAIFRSFKTTSIEQEDCFFLANNQLLPGSGFGSIAQFHHADIQLENQTVRYSQMTDNYLGEYLLFDENHLNVIYGLLNGIAGTSISGWRRIDE